MKVKFYTLGCKVNTYETEAMEQQFMTYGYDLSESSADIYVINTCAVTNIAERKSRQMIRRAKELNPKAIIVVCGCYAQTAKEEIEKIDITSLDKFIVYKNGKIKIKLKNGVEIEEKI